MTPRNPGPTADHHPPTPQTSSNQNEQQQQKHKQKENASKCSTHCARMGQVNSTTSSRTILEGPSGWFFPSPSNHGSLADRTIRHGPRDSMHLNPQAAQKEKIVTQKYEIKPTNCKIYDYKAEKFMVPVSTARTSPQKRKLLDRRTTTTPS